MNCQVVHVILFADQKKFVMFNVYKLYFNSNNWVPYPIILLNLILNHIRWVGKRELGFKFRIVVFIWFNNFKTCIFLKKKNYWFQNVINKNVIFIGKIVVQYFKIMVWHLQSCVFKNTPIAYSLKNVNVFKPPFF